MRLAKDRESHRASRQAETAECTYALCAVVNWIIISILVLYNCGMWRVDQQIVINILYYLTYACNHSDLPYFRHMIRNCPHETTTCYYFMIHVEENHVPSGWINLLYSAVKSCTSEIGGVTEVHWGARCAMCTHRCMLVAILSVYATRSYKATAAAWQGKGTCPCQL